MLQRTAVSNVLYNTSSPILQRALHGRVTTTRLCRRPTLPHNFASALVLPERAVTAHSTQALTKDACAPHQSSRSMN